MLQHNTKKSSVRAHKKLILKHETQHRVSYINVKIKASTDIIFPSFLNLNRHIFIPFHAYNKNYEGLCKIL